MEFDYASPEHRLYDAASRWWPEPHWGGTADLVDAAAQCLADGLDSPSLRLLAGADPNDRTDDVAPLLEATLAELNIPLPDESEPWKEFVAAGRTHSRAARDTIRFEVAPSHAEDVGGHEVLVFVNDVEVTRRGAGMGMSPFDLLIPANRLVATQTPTQVPIAQCECGVYGCGMTDAVIVREGDTVHWEWEHEKPMRNGVSFPAGQYDAEVERVGSDTSWETPGDTTARLLHDQVERERLATYGLAVTWATIKPDDPGIFEVGLFAGDQEFGSASTGYQIFVRIKTRSREPQAVADEMAQVLSGNPKRWPATWHAITPGVTTPPPMAGRWWHREHVPMFGDKR